MAFKAHEIGQILTIFPDPKAVTSLLHSLVIPFPALSYSQVLEVIPLSNHNISLPVSNGISITSQQRTSRCWNSLVTEIAVTWGDTLPVWLGQMWGWICSILIITSNISEEYCVRILTPRCWLVDDWLESLICESSDLEYLCDNTWHTVRYIMFLFLF